MIYAIVCFFAAIIPALLLVLYYYKQDRGRPEPKGLLLLTFLGGIVIIIPVIIIELIFEASFTVMLKVSGIPKTPADLMSAAFKAFMVAGFCEELFKMLLIRAFAYRHKEFDEVMDGVVYTVIGSLGFACFENVLYVMQSGLTVAVIRAIATVPMHAMASGIMGYYIGKARFAPSHERVGLFAKGLFLAILFHGLFDFVIFAMPVLGPLPVLVILPLLIYMFIDLRKKIRTAIEDDVKNGRVAPPPGFAWPPGYTPPAPAGGHALHPGYAPLPGFGYGYGSYGPQRGGPPGGYGPPGGQGPPPAGGYGPPGGQGPPPAGGYGPAGGQGPPPGGQGPPPGGYGPAR